MMDYIPARLVKGRHWYILYYAYDPLTGKRERFRQSFDLNRIKSTKLRIAKARAVIQEINRRLPHGFPYNEISEQDKKGTTAAATAIDQACQVKLAIVRQSTAHQYRYVSETFIRYLEGTGTHERSIASISKSDIMIFLDHLLKQGITPTTHNNFVSVLKLLFNVLIDRHYVRENPCTGIKRMKNMQKSRRAFTSDEAKTVLNHALEDEPLHTGILLQYHCFLRPNELRQIRVFHFNLQEGLIRVPGAISKNKMDALITIPDSILEVIKERISRMGKDWYLFGQGGSPGPNGPAGVNTMGYRHMLLLRSLKDRGILQDISGLSYYSWKDTGVTALAAAGVPVSDIMNQLRHHDLKMTQIYIDSLYKVNHRIKFQVSQLI